MKDLKCCNDNKCKDCAFYGLDALCTFAWHKPSTKLSVIVEQVKKELEKLDKETE